MKVEDLLEDYKGRIEYYDKLIDIELEFFHIARKKEDEELKIEHRGNLRRLRELKQICVQVISDLKYIDDNYCISRSEITNIVYSTIREFKNSTNFSRYPLENYDNWKDVIVDKLMGLQGKR